MDARKRREMLEQSAFDDKRIEGCGATEKRKLQVACGKDQKTIGTGKIFAGGSGQAEKGTERKSHASYRARRIPRWEFSNMNVSDANKS